MDFSGEESNINLDRQIVDLENPNMRATSAYQNFPPISFDLAFFKNLVKH